MESPLHSNKGNLPSEKSPKRGTKQRIFIIFIAIFCIASIGRYLVRTYKIASVSMEPTFYKGDQVMAFRFLKSQELTRGDIVIFPHPTSPKKDWVKRIVGLPEENLQIRQQQVFINDKALNEPYAKHTEPPASNLPVSRDDFGPILIPTGQVFVLGDNRELSADSRQFGLIQIKDISRKAKWIVMSRKNGEITYPWKRIGARTE